MLQTILLFEAYSGWFLMRDVSIQNIRFRQSYRVSILQCIMQCYIAHTFNTYPRLFIISCILVLMQLSTVTIV